MDSGSGLNLIYEEIRRNMQSAESCILPSKTTFKGIILGKEVRCMRRVMLDVVFGSPDNYRIKALSFNIVPFRSSYDALRGRSASAQFHVMPHYAYMKLKMIRPNGVIMISGDPDRSFRTEDTIAALAIEAQSEALAAKELFELRAIVDRDDVIHSKHSKSTPFKRGDEVVKFQVHPEDPSKSASIKTQMDAMIEATLRDFLPKN